MEVFAFHVWNSSGTLPSWKEDHHLLINLGVFFLQENYGKNDETATQKVKSLYKELALKQCFLNHEEQSYQKIIQLISEKSGRLPESLFLDFAKKIYKRNK